MLVGIVAMTPTGLISDGQGMPWNIPTELKFFQNATNEATIIIGANTYRQVGDTIKSFRKVVILTHSPETFELDPEGNVSTVISVQELGPLIKSTDVNYVAGGGLTYAQLMPLCDFFYITEVFDMKLKGAIYFPLAEFYDLFELMQYNVEVDEETSIPLIFKLYRKKRKQND